jgi:TP901 family phage tail tape measure protein
VSDDKRVAVILDAVTAKYEAGMFRAAGATKAFAANSQVQIAKVGQSWDGFAGSSSKNLEKVGKVGLVVGGGIAAAFGLAAYAALNFDKQMSEVGAVAGATGDQLDQLRQAAIDAGQATVFSASEAAQAEAELAKAGVSTADIIGGGLTGALNLASAGGLDLATAATYAANAMATFKLQGADVPRIADTLAAGANKSAADVDQMGQSLQQTGLVADQMGLTLEDTVGVLSMFAQAGLKGSDAGTSLKTMLMRLTPSSKEAKDAMESLGLSFYDAQGNFVGISTAAEQLKTKLGPLTQEQRQLALQTIFGSDAIRAATILYQSGGQGVDQWTDAVSESGYAAELAAQKNDNLAGDLEQLKGSIETALIQGGSQATDALRFMAGGLTDVVNGLGAMPGPLQTAFLGATGLLGVGAAGVGIYGNLAPKLRDVKSALEGMSGIGPSIAGNLGKIGLAAGGVGIALTGVALIYGYFAQQQAEAEQRAEEFVATLDAQTGAITANTLAKVRADLEENNRIDNLNRAKLTVEGFTDALDDNSTGILDDIRLMSEMGSVSEISAERRQSLIGALRAEGGERNNLIATLMEQGELDQGLLAQIVAQSDAYDAQQIALRENNIQKAVATGKTREQAEAEADAAARTTEHTKAIKDAADELRASVDPWYGAYRAQQSLAEAQRTYNETVTEFGATSPQAVDAYVALTDAGFGFEGQLLTLAGSVSAGETSTADLAARLEGLRAYGIDPAGAAALIASGKFNDLAAAAQAADDKNVNIPVAADTEPARRAIDDFVVWANGRRFTIPGSIAAPSVIATGGAGTPSGYFYRREALGGVLNFANGGEHHVAQFAPAGAMRLWAEPETGGEAYIPLARSKWARSREIWAETGTRLGLQPHEKAYAAPAGTSSATTVVNVALAPSFPNYIGDRSELTRAMRAELPAMTTQISDALRKSDRART